MIGAYESDTAIWPIMVALSECLCAELTVAELMPDNCFCGIFPGQAAPWDYQNGMAWVRLVSAFPSNTFPVQETTLRGTCQAPIAAEIEVGVLNCAPMITSTGALPTQEQQFESARLQVATMAAARRAITCCDAGLVFLAEYTPLGPEGGLVGGFWRAWIGQEG